MERLQDRVFIVSGGAGGLGRGIAEALLAEGAKVSLVDLVSPAAVAQEIDGEERRTLALEGDISDERHVAANVAATLERFGRLDGAVNNAGALTLDAAWDAQAADWERQLSVNVTGSFLLARAVGEVLRENGGGAIVNVSSNCGKAGYPNMAAYNASKAAVLGLTRSLSMEWAEHGINVNAVCPGGVDTPMLEDVATWLAPRLEVPAGELLEGMGAAQLGRRIEPIEVGRVVAFLLSDDAKIIRGQSISVDGGDTPY
ncbi:MAG: SDR family oxidoreductase [Acidobacteriota bacterium]